MTTTQITNPADIICGLKAAVTALECYHHMDILKKTQEPEPEKKKLPSMYMMIPIEDNGTAESKRKSDVPCPTNVPTNGASKTRKELGTRPDVFIPGLKFPEMRSGILFTRCYCVHRDGLQDCCPLTQCQGQPECLVKPWPVCPPARYTRCRYPQQYLGD